MRIHALLSFYDEPPASLAACIGGLHNAGVDHLLAVDGAYMLFPDGRPTSDPVQHAVIQQSCHALGMGCTLHLPQIVWRGNEVEKRTRMFQLAWAAADHGDWFMVMDADQIISNVPPDFKARLEQADEDVAEVTFWERRDPDNPQAEQFNWPRESQFPIRILFRAQPIRCRTNHYTYVTQDDRVLWGNIPGEQAPCLDLTDLRVEHRTRHRPPNRREAKAAYYERRDRLGIERGPCPRCHIRKATCHVPHDWVPQDGGLAASLIEVCDECAEELYQDARRVLAEHGIDPDRHLAQLRDGQVQPA